MIVIIGLVVLLMATIAGLAGVLTNGTTTESRVNHKNSALGATGFPSSNPAFGHRHY
ncbi:hypothetical protein [Mycolicibacterium llatzerense]|uniref:hypothetical protein n=1 Tax=Mycolicibacterium llatzerense TaxID=280871 RepID=UPI0021B67F8F|nr:hypothetical protein [Mycolicibacterium llatzerense]